MKHRFHPSTQTCPGSAEPAVFPQLALKRGVMVGLIIGVVLTASSCFEERFTTDTGDTIRLSTDTLTFDTVLTSISTVTRFFKVYNPHDLSIRISEIRLAGDQADFFRINVDGYTGEVIGDIEILPDDSIYVFVEATIDPDQPLSVSPFFLESTIQFMTNGNTQSVRLIAWGQNANYIPGPDSPNRISVLSCDLGEVIWDDPKPYVLYGTLLIDSCTLVLPPGARLYVHGGIANNDLGIFNEGLIYTLPKGKIAVRGSADLPVIIRDDRIEPDHDGEWAGIRLGPESGPHQFSHMRLSRAMAGIVADSLSSLIMDHSMIFNTGGPGLFARHAQAHISNSLFYGNGAQAVVLSFGGQYDIEYCTMASFGNNAEALLMNNFYCSDPQCTEGVLIHDLSARIVNSLLVGSSGDEVWMVNASDQPDQFNVQMENNIVVVDELLEPNVFPDFFNSICTNCVEYTFGEILFADMLKSDYRLDSLSIAEMKAKPLLHIVDDLEGNARDAVMPDIGCYEYK